MSRQMTAAEWMGANGHLIPTEVKDEGHLSLNFTYTSDDGSPGEEMHQRIADDGDIWYLVQDEANAEPDPDDGWDFL